MDPLLPLIIVLALLVDGSGASASPGSVAAGPRCSSLGFRATAIAVPLDIDPTAAEVGKTGAARDLRRLAVFMRERGCRVVVDGYASPDRYAKNTEVSRQRAEAVRDFLIGQRVAAGAIDARGRGVLRDPGLSNGEKQVARVIP